MHGDKEGDVGRKSGPAVVSSQGTMTPMLTFFCSWCFFQNFLFF